MEISTVSPEDQAAWDKMTEDGKGKIITYATKRADRKVNGENPKQELNVHEQMIFDDDDDKKDDTNMVISTNVHQIKETPKKEEDPLELLLHMATHKTVTKERQPSPAFKVLM